MASSNNRAYLDLYSEFFGHLEYGDLTTQFVSVNCPFHDDANASAGISKTTGVFNCYGCESKHSPAQFIARIKDIPLKEAYIIVDRFRAEEKITVKDDSVMSVKRPSTNKRWNDLFKLSQELMSPDLFIVQEYMGARGIRYDILRRMKVGYLPEGKPAKRDLKDSNKIITPGEYTHWGRESLVFPYLLNGEVVGLRYRDISLNKSGETNSHFMLWGIDDMPDDCSVVITVEGETDCLVLLQDVVDHEKDYWVTSAPGAQFRHEWKREFNGVSQHIVIPQDDEAAEKFTKAAKATVEQTVVMNLPWKRRQFGNDISDWRRYNSSDTLIEMIDSVAEYSSRKILSGFEFASAASKPRNWLIENLISYRQIGLVLGAPKSKKTFFMLNLIRSLITKEPLLGISSLRPPIAAEVPNILVIEEEGDIEGLKERVDWILGDVNWQSYTFWGHHLGIRLDTDVWMERLEREILQNKIRLLIIDPFSRTYSVDEDSASDMGKVWDRVAQLTNRFKDLAIIVLHHFNKSGSIEHGWAGAHGSSRTAAEADVGFFMEGLPVSKGNGARLKIEGRSIPTPTTSDGKDVFTLNFEKGILKVAQGKVQAGKGGPLYNRVKEEGGEWLLAHASAEFKVSVNTIQVWVGKSKDASGLPLLVIEGNPKMIKFYVAEQPKDTD